MSHVQARDVLDAMAALDRLRAAFDAETKPARLTPDYEIVGAVLMRVYDGILPPARDRDRTSIARRGGL